MTEIVVHLEREYCSGRYRTSQEKDFIPVKLDGEYRMPWSEQFWDNLFYTYQINDENTCRILLISDRQLDSSPLPRLKNSGATWSLSALAEYIQSTSTDTMISGWYIKDELIDGYERLFPRTTDVRAQKQYIYTFPDFMPPIKPKGASLVELMKLYVESICDSTVSVDSPESSPTETKLVQLIQVKQAEDSISHQ